MDMEEASDDSDQLYDLLPAEYISLDIDESHGCTVENKHLKRKDTNRRERIESSEEYPFIIEMDDIGEQSQALKKKSKVEVFQCKECPLVSTKEYDLKYHIQTQHREGPVVQCSLCSFETKIRFLLNQHILKHRHLSHHDGDTPMLCCDLCPYKTNILLDLSEHCLTHIECEFKCKECTYESNDQELLRLHVKRLHIEGPMFKCDFCPYKTKHKYRLKPHSLTHKPFDEVEVFRCYNCPYVSKRKKDLRVHILYKHSKAPMLRCDSCPYETKFKSKLTNHKKVHRGLLNEGEIFNCADCSFKTIHKLSLNRHILAGHNKSFSKKPIIHCNLCLFKTENVTYFKSHKRAHDYLDGGARLLQCKECFHLTRKRCDMRYHILHRHKAFQCHSCSFRTIVEKEFKEHEKTHTNGGRSYNMCLENDEEDSESNYNVGDTRTVSYLEFRKSHWK